jgi:hypothetical protein
MCFHEKNCGIWGANRGEIGGQVDGRSKLGNKEGMEEHTGAEELGEERRGRRVDRSGVEQWMRRRWMWCCGTVVVGWLGWLLLPRALGYLDG